MTCEITKDGTQMWFNENKEFHRKDGPAVVYTNGEQLWYQNNKPHREDGPAVIYSNGTQYWYKNGKLHREDGPAMVLSNGEKHYCLDNTGYDIIAYIHKLIKNIPTELYKHPLILADWLEENDKELFAQLLRESINCTKNNEE